MCLLECIRRKDPPYVLVKEFLDSLQGQAVLQCDVYSEVGGCGRTRIPQRLEFLIGIPAKMRSRLTRALAARSRTSTSTRRSGTSLQCMLTWPYANAIKVNNNAMEVEEFVNTYVKSGKSLGPTVTFPGSNQTVSSWHLLHVEVDRVLASPQDISMVEMWQGAMELQLRWQGQTVVVRNPLGFMKIIGAS
ncbi:unnamed protein product [Calypogeia fissa]